MSGQESIDSHIQLLIDMDEPINAQDQMIVWAAQRIESLKAELDTFRDASLLLTGKLEDAEAELAALREKK